jgi:hypothetical protein
MVSGISHQHLNDSATKRQNPIVIRPSEVSRTKQEINGSGELKSRRNRVKRKDSADRKIRQGAHALPCDSDLANHVDQEEVWDAVPLCGTSLPPSHLAVTQD